ncbi:glycoside hydrolase [Paenibacillus sp. NPDC056579]|uniref:glycoside hydrolase family 38 N-terminal domain-containing protein n=1 Tax=Paenibacillus sp. NPDC056579 TaxID=3345871 RepID=UPI00368816DA
MRPLKRKWKICIIHHAHTDVGYTERQEKIALYHVDFIKQAIRISEQIRSGERSDWEGFRWTCESFWPVEQFLEQTGIDWHDRFKHAIRAGHIELTANYLHIVEILDKDIFKTFTQKAVDFAGSLGVKLDSAMTADLNGYGWGYAQCLADLGVQNLSMCVHSHHGMFPLWRKQIPFWWETPKGDRLLVWNGDHYNLGNDLGLVPGALLSYIIKDEFETTYTADNHMEIAETRIVRYLAKLEEEEYPLDFVAIMASGLLTDNAPPNTDIMDFVRQWNKKHGERIEIEMSSLSDFFSLLRQHSSDFPVYRGDWPDWWNDGAVSTPMHTQLFRDAQRTLRLAKRLDSQGQYADKETVQQAEHQMMMFAEHTWGHSASISEPWHLSIHALAIRKEAFAAQAHEYASRALDQVLQANGEAPLAHGRPLHYQVLNPSDQTVTDIVRMYVDYWEVPQLKKTGFRVIDKADGTALPYQTRKVIRGLEVCVLLTLAPGSKKRLEIRADTALQGRTTSSYQQIGTDGVNDIKEAPDGCGAVGSELVSVTETLVETPYVKIVWREQSGIVSWLDKTANRELLREDCYYSAFTPIYEVTPTGGPENIMRIRTQMGRNRKGIDVKRTPGRLTGVKRIDHGELFTTVELLYELQGASHCSLLLTAYAGMPRVDVSLRMNKNSVWDPESVYVSLPFTVQKEEEETVQLWLQKPGFPLRPRKDQLPGTGIDFYAIEDGVACISEQYGLAIAMPDTPLVHLGSIEHGERMLHGHPEVDMDNPHLFSWVMTNYWETNFKATLGGFYEFRYRIAWGSEFATESSALQKCRDMNDGLISFRLKE